MNLLNKLLEGTDPNAIKDYESYTQLHLKQIMTTINKHRLEDTIPIKVKTLKYLDKKVSVLRKLL